MRDHPVTYGELVVLGTDGELPGGNKGRRRSRFQLRRRPKPNGVKPVSQQKIHLDDESGASTGYHSIPKMKSHSVTYTLNRSTHIVVKYEQDKNTDMFQIGRSTEPPIDMVLIDIQPGASGKTGSRTVLPEQSTISRFSCRIVCHREPPYTAHIYAAGFDSTNRIFLGERAPKWEMRGGLMDGLTTNGVLIHHTDDHNLTWRELSVEGGVYTLRETRSHPTRGEYCPEFDNVLRDGTLIDLCGATLLWRSESRIQIMPNSHDLDTALDRLNGQRVQCPVGLSTLHFGRQKSVESPRQPYCYLACGHVHGLVEWGDQGSGGEKQCPLCRQISKCVPLVIGKESAFQLDSEEPSYSFNPCGHTVSSATAKYWVEHQLPKGTQLFQAACPFCAIPFNASKPFVKLIYQNFTDKD